jgi:hypothetical protein
MFIYHPVDSRTATRGSYFASQIIYVSMYKSFASGKQNHSPSCNHKNQRSEFIPASATVQIGNGRFRDHARTSRWQGWRDDILVHLVVTGTVLGVAGRSIGYRDFWVVAGSYIRCFSLTSQPPTPTP